MYNNIFHRIICVNSYQRLPDSNFLQYQEFIIMNFLGRPCDQNSSYVYGYSTPLHILL